MTDLRDVLQSMFDPRNRHANFGNVLMRIHAKGFRCHSNTLIDILSPITAFCGLNGTGKSTLLQLAAASCGSDDSDIKPYCIRDFLVVGTLDPNPFARDATVEYRFWQGDRTLKPLTLSRNDRTKRWQGYARRPKRRVVFAGVGLYLPKIEQRDFIVRKAGRLSISSSEPLTDHFKLCTSKILGCSYQSIQSNVVVHRRRSGKVVSVERSNVKYSEAHMGCGEGRAHYVVALLETLPERSLILIEEPETSLHPSAQYEFGRYLIDVVVRRRHQILVTTHSEFLLQALPSGSRVYLDRTGEAINVIPGITALQAKSLMALGHVKALNILVEDECAKAVLSEILRRYDPNFLSSVGIHAAGDANTLATSIRALQATDLTVAAVLDGDKPQHPRENIFKLPGSLPPEKEMFQSSRVKDFINSTYAIDFDDFIATVATIDHHQWLGELASRLNHGESALTCELARVYTGGVSEVEAMGLVSQLKEAPGR